MVFSAHSVQLASNWHHPLITIARPKCPLHESYSIFAFSCVLMALPLRASNTLPPLTSNLDLVYCAVVRMLAMPWFFRAQPVSVFFQIRLCFAWLEISISGPIDFEFFFLAQFDSPHSKLSH